MQSFASPTHTNPPPHKNHAPHFIPRPTKRAQLSPMPQEKFVNICANLWLIENHESHEFHESFFS